MNNLINLLVWIGLFLLGSTTEILSFFLQKDKIFNVLENYGYPVKIHNLFTEDGYQIRLHRIPYSRRNIQPKIFNYKNKKVTKINKIGREPILLVHGLVASGGQWIYYANNSLALMLSDAGFDVWILNCRGTSYATEHKTLNKKSKKYWDYSWHEIGLYDVTRAIDYILYKTKKFSLKYVGHSQGCATLMVALTKKPEYNQKVSIAYLITPGVYLHHIKGLARRLLESDFKTSIFEFLMLRELTYSMFTNEFVSGALISVCQDKFLKELCVHLLLQILGPVNHAVDVYNFSIWLLKYVIDNAATKQILHYEQVVASRKFQMFDYANDNKKIYGTLEPPEYNLTQVKIPIVIVEGKNDFLVTNPDVSFFTSMLKNVVGRFLIDANHVDFLFDRQMTLFIRDLILKYR